jgi:hypothetical protein
MKTVQRPRSRLLSFRLTGEEYEQLRIASAEQGARCLSDFARAALLRAKEAPECRAGESRSCTDLTRLEHRIAAIETGLVALRRLLATDETPETPVPGVSPV